jgi:iron complex transport system substrate-binding protein
LVVLNGDLTEIVFALGAGESVVGVDLTTTYPAEATGLPTVGLGRSLNAERVIELAPTLVLADTQVGPDAAIDQIRQAGIPVAILDLEPTLPGVSRKIARVAAVIGRETAGAALIEQVEAEISAASALAATATSNPRVAYVYVRGPEVLLMFGNGMPTHFLIEAGGGVDALGEAGVVFAEALSAERLVAANPDVLISSMEGIRLIGGVDSFLSLPGVSDTVAGQQGAVLAYDEAMFLGMGPRVGEALRQLVRDLHPELTTP